MLASYKRYWEPSKTEVMFLSLPIGAITTILTQPLGNLLTYSKSLLKQEYN